MDLVEFLLARIAEGEATAREASVDDPHWLEHIYDNPHIVDWSPARVLAECEAKRRIVELHQGHHECVGVKFRARRTVLVAPGYQFANDPTLALLALPYADHPDYDKSWRP